MKIKIEVDFISVNGVNLEQLKGNDKIEKSLSKLCDNLINSIIKYFNRYNIKSSAKIIEKVTS